MFTLHPIPVPEWTWQGIWQYMQVHTDYFIILLIIAINILMILWFFISTVIIHAVKRNKEQAILSLREETENLLSEFIGDDGQMDDYAQRIKTLFDKNPERRHELFDVYLEFLNLVQGQSFRNLQELLHASGLADALIKKLGKTDNPHLLLYMHMASEAELQESKQAFKKLLKHKEREVRFQALCALMEIFQFDAMAYIHEVGFKVNEWEEMILLEKILAYSGRNSLNLPLYLKSDNDQLVRLSIRVAKHTNRYDVEGELHHLLSHKNQGIRNRVYLAIGVLLMNDLEPELLKAYDSESPENQKSILKALNDIGTRVSAPFLENIIREKQSETTLLAARALYEIGGEAAFGALLSEDVQIQHIIHHIQDPLLA